MFGFINRRLSRQVAVWLLLTLLPLLGVAAFSVVYNEVSNTEEVVMKNGWLAARAGARAYGAVLEAGVDSKRLSLEDLLTPIYTKIADSKAAEPRYHSQFDWYTDLYVQGFEDEILHSNPDLIYATALDRNTYTPTTHTEFSQTPTGDPQHDKAVARSKRKYDTELHRKAAQSLVPIMQSYPRDTGDMVWDLAVPIIVKGEHWGAFRVGVIQASIQAHRWEVITELAIIFAVLTSLTVVFVFLVVRSNMKPLEKLIEIADGISLGGDDDNEVMREISKKTNEIGIAAQAFDRMRKSLKLSMKMFDEAVKEIIKPPTKDSPSTSKVS